MLYRCNTNIYIYREDIQLLCISLSLSSHLFIFYNSCGCGSVNIEMLSVVLANALLPKGVYHTQYVIIIVSYPICNHYNIIPNML